MWLSVSLRDNICACSYQTRRSWSHHQGKNNHESVFMPVSTFVCAYECVCEWMRPLLLAALWLLKTKCLKSIYSSDLSKSSLSLSFSLSLFSLSLALSLTHTHTHTHTHTQRLTEVWDPESLECLSPSSDILPTCYTHTHTCPHLQRHSDRLMAFSIIRTS